jgi:hypothetical protein
MSFETSIRIRRFYADSASARADQANFLAAASATGFVTQLITDVVYGSNGSVQSLVTEITSSPVSSNESVQPAPPPARRGPGRPKKEESASPSPAPAQIVGEYVPSLSPASSSTTPSPTSVPDLTVVRQHVAAAIAKDAGNRAKIETMVKEYAPEARLSAIPADRLGKFLDQVKSL